VFSTHGKKLQFARDFGQRFELIGKEESGALLPFKKDMISIFS